MSLPIQNLHSVDSDNFPYIFEQNVTVPLKSNEGLIRVNIYRPKVSDKVPVIATYGPYGKDIPYKNFHPNSWSEVNQEHKSDHSAWETPDPAFWTKYGYAVVRADERGLGQSPGILDTMSRGTSECFFDVVEWAAEQSWSSGKVGLLGISYYAGSQWRVAARQPKGLACMIPWEGMSDYYRDRCRHGGILSQAFIKFWWERQVLSNQYGLGGKSARNWGPDTLEGTLSSEALAANRNDQTLDNARNRFRDDPYYASKEYSLDDIQVPLLSVANWGGIMLHLRGNVLGYMYAGSELKYMRFIVGRHDLPFYYPEEVEIQRSFLDAFLKGDDRVGWSRKGAVAPISLLLRKGDVGYNDPKSEQAFVRRDEYAWPPERTEYQSWHLKPEGTLDQTPTQLSHPTKLSYKAPSTIDSLHRLQFETAPFSQETEITGHPTVRLNVSVSPDPNGPLPSEIDLFVSLRHFERGKEVLYTGTAGDGACVAKGWLRVSLRKLSPNHPKHRQYLPWREYLSTDVQPVIPGEVYDVELEIWPTNVVVEAGGKLLFEVSSGDTPGGGINQHTDPDDRPTSKLQGTNHIHFGPRYSNYLTLPVIPTR